MLFPEFPPASESPNASPRLRRSAFESNGSASGQATKSRKIENNATRGCCASDGSNFRYSDPSFKRMNVISTNVSTVFHRHDELYLGVEDLGHDDHNESKEEKRTGPREQAGDDDHQPQCAFHLLIDADKEKGTLSTSPNKSTKVSVMRINHKGDALIHDGKRIMFVKSKHITIATTGNEDEKGVKRLQFVKQVYQSLVNGDFIDTATIYAEILRNGLLA